MPVAKKTAAKKPATARTRKPKAEVTPVVENTPAAEVVASADVSTRKRPGRKPDPLTPLWAGYRKARAKAEKARAAHAKVENLAVALREAEEAEAAAYSDLQSALGDIPAPPVSADNVDSE